MNSLNPFLSMGRFIPVMTAPRRHAASTLDSFRAMRRRPQSGVAVSLR